MSTGFYEGAASKFDRKMPLEGGGFGDQITNGLLYPPDMKLCWENTNIHWKCMDKFDDIYGNFR